MCIRDSLSIFCFVIFSLILNETLNLADGQTAGQCTFDAGREKSKSNAQSHEISGKC